MMKTKIGRCIAYAGLFTGFLLAVYKKDKEIRKLFKLCQKDERIIKVYSYWMMHKEVYAEYLDGLGVEKIIVYGTGYLGKSLIEELSHSRIRVLYAVDTNPDKSISGLKTVAPTEIKEGADMIIITAIASYYDIKREIEKYVSCPIVSIEEVIYRTIE